MARIVIVDDEPIVRMDIAAMLEDLGYEIAGEAGDGFDAVELCRLQRPDVALMDVKMPVFDGLTAAEKVLQEDLARCVVLLTAFNDADIIERANQAGVTGYLVKPVEQKLLRPTIEVALAQSARLRESRRQAEQARRQLTDSRLIAQAQAILARRENIGDTQAYQWLRKMAMDKRIPIIVLAQALIEQEQSADDVAYMKAKLMREKQLSRVAAEKKLAQRARELGCSVEEAARQMRRGGGGQA